MKHQVMLTITSLLSILLVSSGMLFGAHAYEPTPDGLDKGG
jgi:hypothetical protein